MDSRAGASRGPASDERFRIELQRFARWLGADGAAAAELAQAALVKLWQTPPLARDDQQIASWLRTVVRNEFLSQAALAKRQGVPLADAVLLETAWRNFARDDGGDSRMAALDECLERLPARCRQAVELHYKHGSGHKELGSLLRMSASGVKRLLARSRQLLADCIDERVRR